MPGSGSKCHHDIVRPSTDGDLNCIYEWLKKEDTEGVEDNFLCNWETIENWHSKRKLLVYIDEPSGKPVGFQLGGLLAPGILQVRKDFRRRGIATKLVEHCVAAARRANEPFLKIQCTPESSIPFWLKMGFNLYRGQTDKPLAYRILDWAYQLPDKGESVRLEISFYPEDRKWRDGIEPFCRDVPTAKKTSDGVIHLSRRVACFKGLQPPGRDLVVEIVIDGERLYLEKAKYPGAKRLGVKQCLDGFYVDSITPGADPIGMQNV